MNLKMYDHRYVRVVDKFGESFMGIAVYGNRDFLMHEYGGEEDGIFIEDVLLYNSQIESIEEIEIHGTAELWTENLVLRRFRPEDAEFLYQYLGLDPAMYEYSGWNPYATLEMAQETVRERIESYDQEDVYSWAIDHEGAFAGTVGAYDQQGDRIEIGISIVPAWQGRGFATEALKKVLEYLTENEGISCVTAWCAADNIGSKRAMEKAGMRQIGVEKDGLVVEDRVYDKLIYEYTK